ncbi:hypothetical protein Tco_1351903 [Tanacetum coccineum]
MDQDSAHRVAASKVSMLKPGEFELWRMRIEQYIYIIDYALWEVIKNDATLPKTQMVEGVMTLKFNSIKDAKQLLEAVERRFGGNKATKKTQRNLLKQQYENFTAPSLEMLDHTFDRHQKLKNKAELETMSIDDLYNNLKVYEPEVKGVPNSSSSTQNMAFVSSLNNNNSSTNGAVNTAQTVNTAMNQLNSPQLAHKDLQQIHPDDIEEMDLSWQMAMLTMSARMVFEEYKKEAYWSVELQEIKTTRKSARRTVLVETSNSTALVSCYGLGGYDWSDQEEEGPNYALMAY